MLKKLIMMLISILVAGVLFFSITSHAAVDVFDSNRGKPVTKAAPKKPPPKAKPKPRSRKKRIDVVFVGSSHIDSMILYFKDKQNKQIAVEFAADKKVALPGYDDLIIEKMENRVLYVKDAKNLYCESNAKKGITCLPEKGIIEMKLVRKFIAGPRPKTRQKPVKQKNKGKGVVRIDPKDVPEGKRLVKTPFGDRIVPK